MWKQNSLWKIILKKIKNIHYTYRDCITFQLWFILNPKYLKHLYGCSFDLCYLSIFWPIISFWCDVFQPKIELQSKPENSGIESRSLDTIFDFKYSNEHEAQQLCGVNRLFLGNLEILLQYAFPRPNLPNLDALQPNLITYNTF